MVEIPLNDGMVALVDDADYPLVSGRKWTARKPTRGYCWYAYDSSGEAMHRVILGLTKGDGIQGDHRNPRASLDNRRNNLRLSSPSTNGANRHKNKNNKCGYRGVYLNKRRGLYQAQIMVDRRNIYLGRRDTAEAAWRELYVPAAKHYFGEFARVA